MTHVSIIKLVTSASICAAAGSALFVSLVQHEQRFAADAVTVTTLASHDTPAVRSDAPHLANETPPARAAIQGQAAPATVGLNPSNNVPQLVGPPEYFGKDQPLPSFDIVRVEASGDAVIAGRAPPGATVDLLRGGERLDRAVAGPSGEFVMIPPRLPEGSYELTLDAKLLNGTVTSSKRGALITVSDAGPSARAAQSRTAHIPQAAPQPRSSSEPRPAAPKSEDSAGLQPAAAIDAGSTSDNSARLLRIGRAISRKVVSRGDSLWRISHITYGDGSQYAFLYRANRERIRNPNLIYPGQTLVLPLKRN